MQKDLNTMQNSTLFSRSLRFFTIGLISLSLIAGCGFKLRGDHFIPAHFQTLHISSFDKHAEIVRLVKNQLKANDVNIQTQAAQHTATLRLIADSLDRRTLTLFPNGQIAEYELTYRVDFQVILPGKDEQTFVVEVARDYQDDPDRALAKSRELTLILSEMRQQAAERIIRQLATVR